MQIRKQLIVLMLSLMLLAIGGCEKKSAEKVALRLGYAPIADAAQIYVGMDKGFFEAQGIEIKLEQLGSGAKILEAVGVGSVEIGLSSYVPLVLANAGGLQLQAITGGPVEDNAHPEHAILVKKDSSIKTFAELTGKTVALNGRRNIDHMIFQELLEKSGMTEDHIKIVEIPFPRMETVLDAGDVDAACAIEPFVTRGLEHGNMRMLMYNFLAVYDKIPIACYVTRRDWIDNNQDVLIRFRAAFKKATDFCLANPDETKIIIAKYAKLNNEEVRKIGLPTFANETNPDELQDLINRMMKRGLISQPLNARDLIYAPR